MNTTIAARFGAVLNMETRQFHGAYGATAADKEKQVIGLCQIW